MSRKIDETNVRRAAVQALEGLAAAGVTHLRKVKAAPGQPTPTATKTFPAKPSPASTILPRANAQTTPAVTAPANREPAAASIPAGDRIGALSVLQAEVAGCTLCNELARTRTQTVFGVGNPAARLVFLGEAPGADEDRTGVPFVGRAGQLLTKIIEACTLRREDVYILNVLKCRPPGNRTPLPDEVENCRGFLDRQLELIQPEFICCLGAVASRRLLDVQTPIGKLRGQFFKYRNHNVVCTYHPSYLLRNPAAKKDVWEDVQLLMARMGVHLKK